MNNPKEQMQPQRTSDDQHLPVKLSEYSLQARESQRVEDSSFKLDAAYAQSLLRQIDGR
jgi:hypothetical protein